MYRSTDSKIEAKTAKGRYMHSSIGPEEPSVLTSREALPNKENLKNEFNRIHQLPLSNFKSAQLAKEGKSSAEEIQQGLRSSRQFINYRKKNKISRQDASKFGEYMTFGEVRDKRQITSRDFVEERRLKGEVLDEIMLDKNRQIFSKSWHPPALSPRGSQCVNHPEKSAKYRLISELSEGEQEMFYCSKCAINLVQRGFRVEEIKGEEGQSELILHRMQQISKFELSLRSLEERTRVELDKGQLCEGIEALEEQIISTSQQYDLIIEAAQKMKSKRVNWLKEQYRKRETEQDRRSSKLSQLLSNLADIQQEMTDYRIKGEFTSLDQDRFLFLTSTLQNKINAYQETLTHQCRIAFTQPTIKTMTSSDALESVKRELMKPRARLTALHSHSNRRARTQSEQAEDSFACDEAKMPFRQLFPPSEEPHRSSKMLNSVREQPTYAHYCEY